MIAPTLAEPLRAFERAVASAGVTAADIHSVLLVGGSSRVPLVAETVAGAIGRPVAVDTHPKHAIALGAARLVGAALSEQEDVPARRPLPAPAAWPMPEAAEAAPSEPPAPIAAPGGGAGGPARRRRRRPALFAAIAATLVAAGVGAFVAFGGGSGSASGAGPQPSTTTPTLVTTVAPATSSPPSTTGHAGHTGHEQTCGSDSGLCAFITDIAVEDDHYLVNYKTVGFQPLVPGVDPDATDDDHHVHFFFNSTEPENAGENGHPPGTWFLWGLKQGGGRLVFDGYKLADAAGADQMCVAVATSHHDVSADAAHTGNCVDLPE